MYAFLVYISIKEQTETQQQTMNNIGNMTAMSLIFGSLNTKTR